MSRRRSHVDVLQSDVMSSTSSRRPGSARPVPARRSGSGERGGGGGGGSARGGVKRDENFLYDCKAAYLVVFDDLSDKIRSKDKLMQGEFPLLCPRR